jgi:hypothetical protein
VGSEGPGTFCALRGGRPRRLAIGLTDPCGSFAGTDLAVSGSGVVVRVGDTGGNGARVGGTIGGEAGGTAGAKTGLKGSYAGLGTSPTSARGVDGVLSSFQLVPLPRR